jgi:hypothetical protein
MKSEKLAKLSRLEAVISKGLVAYEERNRLIADLVEEGMGQADLTRRLNAIRAKEGAEALGPCAVAATIRRVTRQQAELA